MGLGKGVSGVVRISRNEGGAGTFPDKDGPSEGDYDPQMARTKERQGHPIFSWLCQFLQMIHQWLLQNDPTPHLTLQKRCGLVIQQR